MRLIAPIEDPNVARRILECLDLPARAPPIEPAARAGSLAPEADFADEEPLWEFDQTPPDEEDGG